MSVFPGYQSTSCRGEVAHSRLDWRPFSTSSRLLKDAPPPHPCPHCSRSFKSVAALGSHMHAKHEDDKQRPPTSTPIDVFFQAYEREHGFKYDRAHTSSASFAALRAHMGWTKDDHDSNHAYAKQKYRAALKAELKVWFGSDDDLANWHALCRAVGIAPLPLKRDQCQEALREKHVNLQDLLKWARGEESEVEIVKVFQNVEELATYTRKEDKWFPLEEVKYAGTECDGRVVIKHLLRRLGR